MLAIVMPAYNEAACIEKVARAWMTIFDRIDGRLFVVDDGSKDETSAILDRMASGNPRLRVIHQPNSGHGAAVVRGYDEAIAAQSAYVFQTDSDDQFNPRDFWRLWELRDQSPFVLGYRRKRSDAPHRLVISRIVVLLNLLLFGALLRDSNIPFRLMRTEFLRELLEMMPRRVFAPNIFLSVLAAKAGARLYEVPISHEERKTGRVSILRWKLIRVCLRCVGELVVFHLQLWANRNRLRSLRTRHA